MHQGEPEDVLDIPESLVEARAALQTEFFGERDTIPPVAELSPEFELARRFELVDYPAPNGDSAAYVSRALDDGRQRPAIIWLRGGFSWGLSPWILEHEVRSNDQSLRALLHDELVVMAPSLRGQSNSPGSPECFLGEVDDILAAAEWLATRPDVDPERIFMGGHSTGGTLAVLAAASESPFAAVFAFGPIDDPVRYDRECPPRDLPDEERIPRTPHHFTHAINVPTWLIGGEYGNADSIESLLEASRDNQYLRASVIPNFSHFEPLRPGMELIVEQIVAGIPPEEFQLSAEAILQQNAPRPWPERTEMNATVELLYGEWAIDPAATADAIEAQAREEMAEEEPPGLEYLKFRHDGNWSYVVPPSGVRGFGEFSVTTAEGSVLELAIVAGNSRAETTWRLDFHTRDALVSTGAEERNTMALRRLR